MKSGRLLFFLLVPALLALAGVLFLLTAQPARAQCVAPSSCKSCHEIQAVMPVSQGGLWHRQHTLFDFCDTCHGGDRYDTAAGSAHAGLRTAWADISAVCADCHPSQAQAYMEIYAAEPGLNADPTGGAMVLPSDEPITAAPALPSVQTAALAVAGENPLNTVLLAVLAICLLGAAAYVIWNERRLKRGGQQAPALVSRLVTALTRENWSPYAAGVLLGVTGILAVWAGKHLLSAAGPTATLTSLALHALSPAAADANMYFRFVVPPAVDWLVMLLIGVFLGGMLGALSSGALRLRWNDDPVWQSVFGKSVWKRILLGFGGALLLQYGASLAGGCTSGLAISGGMLLTPSAFLFIAAMFASGILTARILFRRKS